MKVFNLAIAALALAFIAYATEKVADQFDRTANCIAAAQSGNPC